MKPATTKERASLTFVIADIIRHMATARMKSEILANESFVRGTSKDTINRIGLKCTSAINEVRDMLNAESRKIMDDELISAEVFLQIDGVVTAMYAMPKGIRDEIEAYVMSRYAIYSLNDVAA